MASTCSLRRSQMAGTAGAGQRWRSRHQLSHAFAAARLRFHVDSAAVAHRALRTAAISSSEMSASSRPPPSSAASLSMTPAYARRVFAFSHRGEDRNASAAACSVTPAPRGVGSLVCGGRHRSLAAMYRITRASAAVAGRCVALRRFACRLLMYVIIDHYHVHSDGSAESGLPALGPSEPARRKSRSHPRRCMIATGPSARVGVASRKVILRKEVLPGCGTAGRDRVGPRLRASTLGVPRTRFTGHLLVNAAIMPWRPDGARRVPVVGCGSRGVRAASARCSRRRSRGCGLAVARGCRSARSRAPVP